MPDNIYQLYQYTSNASYLVFHLYAMQKMFGRKRFANKFVYYVIPTLLFWAIYYFPQYALKHKTIPYYYYFTVLMIISLIWILFFVKEKLIHKLPYFAFHYALYKCMVTFIGSFLYQNESNMNHDLYEYLDVLSYFFIFTTIVLFARLYMNRPLSYTLQLTTRQTLLLLFSPISFFVLFQMTDPSIKVPYEQAQTVTAFILAINIAIIYLLYSTIGEQYESRYQLGKALTETSAQLTRYRYTILIEEQARKERHELKNRYFYIQTLLREKKYEQLDAFLSEHIGELSDQFSGIKTNNVLIDHIINTKLQQAHKYHIKTYTEILIPEELLIDENRFCTILLNLLDNAIEASQKESNPDIQVKMNIRNQYLVCIVKNKVSSNILENNPDFHTTKSDVKHHGLGMKIIQESVKKTNAIFDIKMEGNYFTATVMLPIEAQKIPSH